MKIPVYHPKKPGIRNTGFAATFCGEKEIAMFESTDGYIPKQLTGWGPWYKCEDVFGHTVYFAEILYK